MPIADPTKPTRHGRGNEVPIHLTQRQEQRFWQRVPGKGSDGCWEWGGSFSLGYGRVSIRMRHLKAHRVAWTLMNGPIPRGLTLDHLCRNTKCVNPAHLEVVTMRENILRGGSPTAVNAQKTYCARGHELTPANTKVRKHLGSDYRQCRACLRMTEGVRRLAKYHAAVGCVQCGQPRAIGSRQLCERHLTMQREYMPKRRRAALAGGCADD